MQIEKIQWKDGVKDVQLLATLNGVKEAKLDVGIVTFPQGTRIPEEGFSVHQQTEVAFIVDGVFELYTPDDTTRVGADELVIIPAGQPHANLALTDARVLFTLFGPSEL